MQECACETNIMFCFWGFFLAVSSDHDNFCFTVIRREGKKVCTRQMLSDTTKCKEKVQKKPQIRIFPLRIQQLWDTKSSSLFPEPSHIETWAQFLLSIRPQPLCFYGNDDLGQITYYCFIQASECYQYCSVTSDCNSVCYQQIINIYMFAVPPAGPLLVFVSPRSLQHPHHYVLHQMEGGSLIFSSPLVPAQVRAASEQRQTRDHI